MSDLRLTKIAPPFRGVDAVSSPAYVREGFAPVMTNFLPGRPGKAVLRGGIQQCSHNSLFTGPAAGSTGWAASNLIAHDDIVLGQIDGSANISRYDLSSDGANFTGGMSGVSFLGQYARVGSQTNVVAVGNTQVYGWNGSAFALLAQSPKNVAGIASHLNRFFFLGGSVPGTATPVFANKLYWCDDGAPGSGAIGEYQDDVTGVVNQITVGDTDDFGMGLAVVNGVLYIFKRFSVYALYGTSPATFVLKRVLNIGAVDHGGILPTSDGVFFMSDVGWMFYDGAQLREASEQVRGLVQAAVWKNGPNIMSYKGTTRVKINAAPLGDDSYMLVVTDLFAAGNVLFCGVYQRRTNTWWMFDAPIMKQNPLSDYAYQGPQSLVFTRRGTWCWDGGRMWRIDGVTLPGVPNFQVANLVQPARVGSDVGRTTDGTEHVSSMAYSGRIDTRIVDLASPANMSRLSRVLTDYQLELSADNPAATSRFEAEVIDGSGADVVPAPATLVTNLVPNPSFERGVLLNGWAKGTGVANHPSAATTFTQVQDVAQAGANVGQMVCPATANSGVEASIPGTFKQGVTYTFAIYHQLISGTGTLKARIIDTANGDNASANFTAVAGPGYGRASVSWTPSADRTSVQIQVMTQTAAAVTVYLDAAMVVVGASAPAYFDGDSLKCMWLGTPHLSASAQLPAGTVLPAGTGRQRKVIRDYSEVEELLVRYTYLNPDNLYIAKGEFFDTTIEWRPGRPRFA